MPRPTILLLMLAVLLAATPAAHAQTDTVEVQARGDPLVFEPEDITVEAGTTVRWVNAADTYHTVTSTDSLDDPQPNGMFDEELTEEGDTFEYTFDEEGTFEYYCKPHVSLGMIGTVTVTAGGGGNGDPGTTPTENGAEGGGGGDGEDTPAPGLLGILVTLAAALVVARRQH